MAKPSDTFNWADSGGDVVEPTSGKKDRGFVVREEPAAQHLNWLLGVIGEWLQWLDDAEDSDHLLHGVVVGKVPGSAGVIDALTSNWVFSPSRVGWVSNDVAPGKLHYGINGLLDGDRLIKARAFVKDSATAAQTITLKLTRINPVTFTSEQIGSTATSDNSSNRQQIEVDLTGGDEHTVESGWLYYLEVECASNSAASNLESIGGEFDYDRGT